MMPSFLPDAKPAALTKPDSVKSAAESSTEDSDDESDVSNDSEEDESATAKQT